MKIHIRQAISLCVSISLVPCFFVGILIVWGIVDRRLGESEVSQFITNHQSLVAEHLSNPKVHSFSLSRVPDCPHILLIQFDVDNKETYLMLEGALDDRFHLRHPAKWKTELRSHEDLGFSPGFAAEGMSEAVKSIEILVDAALGSIALSGLFLVAALIRSRRR